MKQGRASTNNKDGRKVEPRPHAINPGAVGQFGSAVDPKAAETYSKGMGYRGPRPDNGRMAPGGGGRTIHGCGSQGRHDE